jgi:hypothetical protein
LRVEAARQALRRATARRYGEIRAPSHNCLMVRPCAGLPVSMMRLKKAEVSAAEAAADAE